MKNDIAILGSTISHGGAVVSGSTLTSVDGIPIARIGDSVTCSTHGSTTIVSGSSFAKDENKFIARVNDACGCGATIATGSSTVRLD